MAALLNRHALLPETGDLGGCIALGLFDLEIGQVELLCAGYSAVNGGLDLLDPVVVQRLVRIRTTIAAIRVEGSKTVRSFKLGRASTNSSASSVWLEATWTFVINCNGLSGSHVSVRLAT